MIADDRDGGRFHVGDEGEVGAIYALHSRYQFQGPPEGDKDSLIRFINALYGIF